MPTKEYYMPRHGLVQNRNAELIERANIPRSTFTSRFQRLTTFDAGYLVPFLVDEILPGDHMRYRITAYVRMNTPLFPMYSNQEIATFLFFVPNRLTWENWVRMMGEQPTGPSDSIAFTVPKVVLDNADLAVGTIYDHMGLPAEFAPGAEIDVNVLPLRAYNLIWNAWFRDQNVNGATAQNIDNGPDDATDYVLKRRNKLHDYFTSALPWPQKFTAPTVPVGGLAPVQGIGVLPAVAGVSSGATYKETPLTDTAYTNVFDVPAASAGEIVIRATALGGTAYPSIYADLSQATGVAINVFRQAFMIQTLLERDARGGTRYTELLLSHFGVVNPDFRLQRPEYIGGGVSPLQLTPIAQTAPTAGATVGALGATGTGMGTHNASYAATEHGFIIGLINVRSELYYQQGLHKMWSRGLTGRYDYYWPALAALGEQAISTAEIYSTGDGTADAVIFGYQERWHEYRTRYSDITGYFRSTYSGTLDAWHLGQRFTAAPTLSAAFLREEPPMERVLAAGEESLNQQYLANILIDRTATRAIPTFGTPATLGRF